MPDVSPREIQRTRRLLTKLRSIVPGYGRERLELTHLRDLRSRAGLNVVIVDDLVSVSCLWPEVGSDSYRELEIRRGTPLRAKNLLVLYHAARAVSNQRQSWRKPALATALLGVLSSSETASNGADWTPSARADIRRLFVEAGLSGECFDAVELLAATVRFQDFPNTISDEPTSARAESLRVDATRARDTSQHADAEWLFREAGRVATVEGDWLTFTRSLVGLAITLSDRGELKASQRCYERALEEARSHCIGIVIPMALHGLFALAVEAREWIRADRLARETFEAFQRHPSPYEWQFAHDVAHHWLKRGDAESALPVLRSALPYATGEHRPIVLGNLAWAAGACEGHRGELHDFVREIETIADQGNSAATARALAGAARGLIACGATDRGRELAKRSGMMAMEMGSAPAARVAAEALSLWRPISAPPAASRRDLASAISHRLFERLQAA